MNALSKVVLRSHTQTSLLARGLSTSVSREVSQKYNLKYHPFYFLLHQGCILFYRSWVPSQVRFEKLPLIFTTKSSFLLSISLFCPPYFYFLSRPFYLPFSIFFFPSYLPSWKASQMDLKSIRNFVLTN